MNLERIVRQKSPYIIGLETFWLLVGPKSGPQIF